MRKTTETIAIAVMVIMLCYGFYIVGTTAGEPPPLPECPPPAVFFWKDHHSVRIDFTAPGRPDAGYELFPCECGGGDSEYDGAFSR